MRKYYIITALLALFSFGVLAQTAPSHTKYVPLGSSTIKWFEAYSRLGKDGTEIGKRALYEGDAEAAENENFFISRVKPRERFTFTKTQVKESLNPARKLLWWCPLGVGEWNAVPNYFYGSEVFSMWSYVDIYGNWTSPMIQAAGAFLDVCHKNGVAAGVVAGVPFGASPSEGDGGNGQLISTLYDSEKGGSDKLLKFLRYYGIDGVGWNSEFSWRNLNMPKFRNLMGDCYAKAASAGVPLFNNAWYSFTSNSGGYGDYSVLNTGCSDWFNYGGKTVSSVYFLNYNWGNSALYTSQTTARNFPGRSSFDVYAGMNYQGGGNVDWTSLKNYDISFGLWGAHNVNMLYEVRGENGSSIPQQQKSYQLISENSFTGSSYNPVNTPEIKNNLSHTSKATNFHGFSSFITARSSLTCADLAQDPFVTYFNLGNGTFFKIDGETTFNHEWYNIGMQDYLPTWRWWWTSKYMGKSTSDATKTLTAEFTWNDAWFGGSCLQISGGTTSDVYLQLFKTKYQTAISGDYITIRYKVLSGTGSMAWACSTEDAPTTAVSQTIKNNAVPTGTWVKSRIQIANSRSGLKVQDAILAQIGLKFSNTTSDFKVLIGEMSLVREASETPAAPVIVKSRALASNYKGVDLKVIFKMNSSSSQPDIPVYNKDVKTWFFKVYAQQEGSTEIMCTTTTSWASYLVGVPYDKALGGRVRIGVSAVSLDGNSESNVTWGEWLSVPAATVVEGFSVSKSIIKAGEDFTVSFNDPNHPAAEWQVKYSKDDALKYSGTVHDFTMQLTEEGLYDLYLTMNGKTDVYRGMIQISPAEVGAMPKINSFTGNGHEDNISIKEGASVEFNYTGRADADGKVSRGVSLGGNGCGFSMSQIPGINNRSIFTVSFWLYINSLTPEFEGTTLLQIRYCKDGWPANNWGYMWCDINADSQYHLGIKDSDGVFKPGFEFKPGAWYHLAYVFDYSSQRDIHGYINGKYIGKKSAASPAWKYENQLLIGGKAANRSGLDGYIDELQFYNKALSAAEVEASMKHQTDIAPASPLIGYWDFESTPMADYTMKSTGSNKDLIAGIYEVIMLSESESDFKSQPFSFAPGAPFISGDVYKITTLPKWTYKGATVESSEGNASAGSSRVNYVEAGNYSATLTLENSWGSDSKTIKYISVTTGIENVTLDEMRAFPNPFIDEVYVRFENGGNYTVDIFDNAGRQVSSRNVAVETGGMVNIQVNGAPGVYFVKVKNDTTLFKAMKLIKQ